MLFNGVSLLILIYRTLKGTSFYFVPENPVPFIFFFWKIYAKWVLILFRIVTSKYIHYVMLFLSVFFRFLSFIITSIIIIITFTIIIILIIFIWMIFNGIFTLTTNISQYWILTSFQYNPKKHIRVFLFYYYYFSFWKIKEKCELLLFRINHYNVQILFVIWILFLSFLLPFVFISPRTCDDVSLIMQNKKKQTNKKICSYTCR